MADLREKLNNVVEYFGVRSPSYFHALTPCNYDPSDFLAYYIDESGRADYPGPHDDDGIPMYNNRGHIYYFPILVCLCGLAHLERYRRTDSENDRRYFLDTTRWLVDNQRDNGSWVIGPAKAKYNLGPDWPSAMMQGLGISCLTRAWQLTDTLEYLDRAKMAVKPYSVAVSDGGVTSIIEGHVFYEEFPALPPHHVLNGFIFALWGLYDLVRLIDDDQPRRLYGDGLETLIAWLPRYDMGYWSRYHIGHGPENPASLHYHRLHIEQLKVMHTITGHAIFEKYHALFTKYHQGRFNALRTLPKKIWWNLVKGF